MNDRHNTDRAHGRRTLIICIALVTMWTEWLIFQWLQQDAQSQLLRELSRSVPQYQLPRFEHL